MRNLFNKGLLFIAAVLSVISMAAMFFSVIEAGTHRAGYAFLFAGAGTFISASLVLTNDYLERKSA